MTKNKNKKSSEAAKQEAFKLSDGICYCKTPEDITNMPKTIMIEAEFDYYRLSNEVFVERLKQAGKDVEVILYEGLDHGFFDRLGRLPQTADCIEEISWRVKEM